MTLVTIELCTPKGREERRIEAVKSLRKNCCRFNCRFNRALPGIPRSAVRQIALSVNGLRFFVGLR